MTEGGHTCSDGAGVEWGLGTKQTSHTIAHGLREMGLMGWSGLGLLQRDSESWQAKLLVNIIPLHFPSSRE